MPNYSVSEENYIKAIFHLQQTQVNVTTNQLACLKINLDKSKLNNLIYQILIFC